ncbi:MAG: DNA ligase-associated DEXH box helicase, partial [Planctomycetota bacterium]
HRKRWCRYSSDAAMRVKYQSGATLGTVEENFISRVQPGEKFLFGGRLVQLLRIRDNVAFVKRATGTPDTVPRWMGGRMPLSSELSSAMRWRLQEAGEGVFRGREMRCLRPLLELQKRWSCLPTMDQFLIERIKTRDGHQMFFYPFEGRLAHEGLAALLSFRLSKRNPVTYSIACNDYGFVLQSKDATPLQEAIDEGLFDSETLEPDILESMNATEMAKRQFRQIAHVAGLIHPGYPGRSQSSKNLQASSNLFFDVFQQYDPGNLLLLQAKREVLQQQLEFDRMLAGLDRIASSQVVIKEPLKVTPLSFPLLVDRLRERVSSETIASRIQKLQQQLEKEAEKSARQRERKSGEQATK